jgi:hypothetical protein
MSTDPASLIGLPYPVAAELARQIDGTPNAAKLSQCGIPGPVAVELVRQMTAHSGDEAKLVNSGIPPHIAKKLKSTIG